MTEVGIPEDIRDIVKGTTTGLHQFIEAEVLPLEEQYKALLDDERRLFRDDGRLVDEVVEARRQVRMKSAQAGFYTMFAPESIGGGGLSPTAMVLVFESLFQKCGPGRPLITWGKGCLSVPVIASFVDGPSHMLMSINETVRTQYLPHLISGEKTLCFALSESDAGSDIWAIKTRGRKDGDEWVINGSKQWITNAPYADYAVVFAVTNEELVAQHRGGITAFLVEASAPGYSMDGILPVMGHQGGDCGSISLDNVRVSNEHILGQVDRGFDIAMFGISEGRIAIASGCVGMSRWALERSLDYAKQRVTFGQPIAEHQAIQFMLADMAIDIYTAKYMVLQTARLIEAFPTSGRLPVKEISICKAYGVEMAQRVFDRAIQIHGAMGLSKELPLEEGFRIARTLRIPDGTSEIQRRTIARQLLRGDTVF